MAVSTFFFIFLLFFLTYALIGSYLLGAGLEAFSSFMNSVHTSFEMMNANIPFESLLGGVEDSTLTILTICFYCALAAAPATTCHPLLHARRARVLFRGVLHRLLLHRHPLCEHHSARKRGEHETFHSLALHMIH